ncbi:MAG: pyridoxamine 5'-phosphate oxidase family protein [Firmicutes bacterium]|nr:pyridoxamine 5'-phosphate oxidase family protein [Bacillota bacterium]
MSDVYKFLRRCGIYYLATVNGGKPAVRPMGAVMEHEGELYFSTGNGKEMYSQIIANPAIQIVGLQPGTRNWIRIDGKAVEVNDVNIKQVMLDACPVLVKYFDSKDCGFFALFKIDEMEAAIY